MDAPLSEKIERICTAFGNKPAVVEPLGREISFAGFFSILLRFAECLKNHGIKPGDHVAVNIREQLALAVLKLAVMRLGAFPIAVAASTAGMNGPIRVDWAVVPTANTTGQDYEIPFDSSWLRPPESFPAIHSGGGIIHATSGTTGIPKLRKDSEAVFLARIYNGLMERGEMDGPVFVGQNVGTLIGIKSFTTALLQIQPQISMQDTPERTLWEIVRNRIKFAFLPPIHLKTLAERADSMGLETPDLKRINVGGGALRAEFAAYCESVFGCEIYTDYGSTETDTIACFRASRTKETPGLVGPVWKLFNVDVRTSGEEHSGGEDEGEILVRVPENMRTMNYPENVSLFDENGWIDTGDLGHLSPTGDLVLTGRKSDMINVGGNKLSPLVIESKAREFDTNLESVAFRIPTETGADAIGLAVIESQGVDQEQLLHFFRREGITYDILIVPVSSFPMTETGKASRNTLSDSFAHKILKQR